MKLTYDISEVRPYINWIYFFHAWSMNGLGGAEKDALLADAGQMLDSWQGLCHTYAVFEVLEANSDGDDLLIGSVRIPMLRQQRPAVAGQSNLCLADFVRPLASGVKDRVGAFATTVDPSMEKVHRDDVYLHLLSQVLCDRLAEATAELMHLQVRRTYWGYAPDENLSMSDLLAERYQGIRPAVGYPSLPDTSLNFILSDLVGMKQIGIQLTETGMMQPHASVSGLMFAHPQARYFDLGQIGDAQLHDYARRRGLPVAYVRRFLSTRLAAPASV